MRLLFYSTQHFRNLNVIYRGVLCSCKLQYPVTLSDLIGRHHKGKGAYRSFSAFETATIPVAAAKASRF